MDYAQSRDASGRRALTFDARELMLIANGLNEVCNGIDIDESEFLPRIGGSRDETRAALRRFGQAYRDLLAQHRTRFGQRWFGGWLERRALDRFVEDGTHGSTVVVSDRELMLISNALRDICDGDDIEDSEFQTRLGWEPSEMRNVVRKVNEARRLFDRRR